MINFRIRENGLTGWRRGLEAGASTLKDLHPVAQKSGQVLLPLIRAQAPKRTGRSAARIALSVAGAEAVINGPAILAMLAHGTRPHEIRARNARALRFTSHGGTVFARSVRHPGTKPNPFVKEAFDLAKAQVLLQGIDALKQIVSRIKQG